MKNILCSNRDKAKTVSKLLGAAASRLALHQGDVACVRRPTQTVLFGPNLFIERDDNLTLAQEKAFS